MQRTIGIIFLGILNVFTSIVNFFITWLVILGFSVGFEQWTTILTLLTFFLSIGIEIAKWMAFYFIIRRKRTKWLIFYGIYGGGILILMYLLLQPHPLLFFPIMYFISMFFILNDNQHVEDTADKETITISEEQVPDPHEKNNNKLNTSVYFHIGLVLLLFPLLILSYYVYNQFYELFSDMMVFDSSGRFLLSLLILTSITVVSWAVIIHLWKKGHSNWQYFFVIPMVYQIYLLFKEIATLVKTLGITVSFEFLQYRPITLNVFSIILYAFGMIILHRGNNNFSNKQDG